QVAATEGIIALAAYAFLVVAFLRTFWRARRIDQAVLVFAGWIGYRLAVLANLPPLASTLPFWIFAAVAMVSWEAVRTHIVVVDRRASLVLGSAVGLAAAALTVLGVVVPYLADQRLREAVAADYAGRPQEAQGLAAQSRQLAPRESVYAVEVGNTAFEQNQWAPARTAYQDAAGLGTFNALVYRNLALADRNLGLLPPRAENHRPVLGSRATPRPTHRTTQAPHPTRLSTPAPRRIRLTTQQPRQETHQARSTIRRWPTRHPGRISLESPSRADCPSTRTGRAPEASSFSQADHSSPILEARSPRRAPPPGRRLRPHTEVTSGGGG